MSDKVKTRWMIAGAAFAPPFFSGPCWPVNISTKKQSAEAFDEVAELVKEDVELPTLTVEGSPAQEPEALTAFEKYADVYAQNSDLVGWVSIPGTGLITLSCRPKTARIFTSNTPLTNRTAAMGALSGRKLRCWHFRQPGAVRPPHEQRLDVLRPVQV